MTIELKDRITEHFTDEQAELVLAIVDEAKAESAKTAEDSLYKHRVIPKSRILDDDFLAPDEVTEIADEYNARSNRIRQIWDNQGVDRYTGRKYSIDALLDYSVQKKRELNQKLQDIDQDLLMDSKFSMDQPLFIQRTVTEYVKEAVEPQNVLTPLLTPIQYQSGTHITFPAMSAVYAQDIPEFGEYPEQQIEVAGTITAEIGKAGLALAVSEEMIRYSRYDVISIMLRAAGNALARHRELKVVDMLTADAVVDFDNDDGGEENTTGRAIDGTGNGTFILDDLFTMFANAASAGWQPNTLIMHPMGWLIFARDPVMRAFGFANNGELMRAFQGRTGNVPQWRGGGFINNPDLPSDPGKIATTFTSVPDLFPFSPINIVVSPYVPFDSANNKTDIYLVDGNDFGFYIQDEDLTTDEWNEPKRDMTKIKFRERYAIASSMDSKIRVAKNVVVAKAYDFQDRITWDVSNTGLPSI